MYEIRDSSIQLAGIKGAGGMVIVQCTTSLPHYTQTWSISNFAHRVCTKDAPSLVFQLLNCVYRLLSQERTHQAAKLASVRKCTALQSCNLCFQSDPLFLFKICCATQTWTQSAARVIRYTNQLIHKSICENRLQNHYHRVTQTR